MIQSEPNQSKPWRPASRSLTGSSLEPAIEMPAGTTLVGLGSGQDWLRAVFAVPLDPLEGPPRIFRFRVITEEAGWGGDAVPADVGTVDPFRFDYLGTVRWVSSPLLHVFLEIDQPGGDPR